MGEKPLAVVLLSGGMDSCVTAAIAAQRYEIAALHFNYGQRTEKRERRAFREQARFFQARATLEVELAHLRQIGGSSLTDLLQRVEKYDEVGGGVPSTYVPFRNGQFLAVATSWAEVLGAEAIFIGAVEPDAPGYPDCRPAFYEAFQRAIDLGTRPDTRIRIETPVIHKTKEEIVRLGVELGAPFDLTWSCYQDNDVACGVCDSCYRRLQAFAAAGVTDPIPYASSAALR